jgi:hypothetical protein
MRKRAAQIGNHVSCHRGLLLHDMMRAVSVSRRMACSSIQHRAIAGMTILRDACSHVAYPGRTTYSDY